MSKYMGSTLPIAAFREQIVSAVKQNPVVLITAETGAGKSTQVPQYLLEEGYDLVVTQPRRLATRTVSARVAEERGERLGGVIGYRTAYDRQDSPATRCLFCTDGLALVRELMGVGQHQVLVLDEVHEWNLNMEVLCAWSKRQVEAGGNFKVVVMSATLEAEELSRYFGGAPVISVPGRLYPVEEKPAGRSLEADVATLLREGRNVLVFQPGKREIGETIDRLRTSEGLSAELLPLHGELEPEDQNKCFRHYGRPKCVVSTNVAQTSVTIDDIDAVVDAGTERRVELVGGVEGLYLKPISLADRRQRKGRAGRTKPGIYIDFCPASDRPEFPKAEILRTRLDQTVLRLAEAGIDAEELSFFHQPPRDQIHEAKRALKALGCMEEDGRVTRMGRHVAKLPVSVQFARMIVEAERLGVVDDVITVAAILEQGEITARPKDRYEQPAWRKLVPGETESDIIAQLAVFHAANGMSKDEMVECGVFAKAYFQAKDKRRLLVDALRQKIRFGTDGNRENILRAVCSGMVDHLYRGEYGRYRNGESIERELGQESLVSGATWIVGLPWDLQIQTRRGPRVLKLIRMASKVDPAWLVEVAPQLAERKTGLNPRYDAQKDVVVSTTQTFFNGQKVQEETVADEENSAAAAVFARWLAGQSALPVAQGHSAGQTLDTVLRSNAARQERARQLNIRTGEKTFQVYSSDEMIERFVAVLSGARRILEVFRPEALALPGLDESTVVSVLRDNPDTIEVLGSELVVEYRQPYYGTVCAPRVKLSDEMVKAGAWIRLADEGVILPGGRSVELVVSFDYSTTLADTNIPQLKAKVREHLNREQWGRWTRPEIVLPDTDAEEPVIPPITTATYGSCVVTGEPLEVFGAVTVNPSRYYTTDPYFKGEWFTSREKADAARTAAVTKLEQIREELRAQRERTAREEAENAALNATKTEAEAAREELRGLSSHNGFYDLVYELLRKAEDRRYSYLPSTAQEIRAWTVETKAITAEVQTALSDLQRKREEEARARETAEQEQRGKLRDLLAHDWVRDDLGLAERIDAFVKEALQIRGRDAARLLRDENYEAYGRGRRTASIEEKFPGINHQGLDWAAGRDIVVVVFWTETQGGTTRHQETARALSPTSTLANGGPFTHIGGRDFRCQAGHSTRIGKSEFASYNNREQVTITCSVCDATGIAKKEA